MKSLVYQGLAGQDLIEAYLQLKTMQVMNFHPVALYPAVAFHIRGVSKDMEQTLNKFTPHLNYVAKAWRFQMSALLVGGITLSST